MRLAILLDVADHPGSTTTEVRKRIDKPRATVDRQLQSLHMLGLLDCNEDENFAGNGTRWRYSLVSGVDPDVLTITRKVTDYTQEHKKRRGAIPTSHISGNSPPPSADGTLSLEESL
jgi:predicted transcriptional regulator